MAWKNARVLSETTGKICSYFPELNQTRGCNLVFLSLTTFTSFPQTEYVTDKWLENKVSNLHLILSSLKYIFNKHVGNQHKLLSPHSLKIRGE